LYDLSLNQLFLAQAEKHPAKIALQFGDEGLSYDELDLRASQVARGLLERGIGAGDRVAYLGKNSIAYFELLLGAAKVRAITVPVNWRLAMPEIDFILGNSRAKLLLVEAPFDHPGFEVPRLISEPGSTSEAGLRSEPGLINGSASIGGGGQDTYARWRDAQAAERIDTAVDPLEPVLQLYTSGTTGRPKGVMLTHRSLFGLRTDMQLLPDWWRWSADDVSLIAMPVAHISGTGWALWSWQCGATAIIMRDFSAETLLELMVRHRTNKIMLVPTALQIAARHPRSREIDFGFLRYLYYGGAPLLPSLLNECVTAFRCGFVQMYGMTETSGTVVALAPEDHTVTGSHRLGSVGKALPGVELKIIDAAGCPVDPEVSGEVAIRSISNMAGYFEMPEATANTVDKDGWLRTGDMGYLDADGYLYLQDRVKDMIISGGENIYPTEVESALSDHPAVGEVAVIGVPDDKWGESVKAFIVSAQEPHPSYEELVAWAARRIARFKLPRSIEFVGSLPRNHTGKILRRELRRQCAQAISNGSDA
jgi:acyl-CoA synthetase (AMP-forming)/AMP-acid ligase II